MSSPSTIDRLLRDHDDGSYFARLVNAPSPHLLRKPPVLVYHATRHDLEPRFTIVTPTFNCASTIGAYMEATACNASMPFDWILIDDGSDDDTVGQARVAFESSAWRWVARATIIRNPVPIFETACDNIGFNLAETNVIIEIQSDIHVREAAFDALIMRAFALRSQPAAVSGRCGHSFLGLRGWIARAVLGFGRDRAVGLAGRLIETPEVIDPLRGRIFRCDTVPRGPWAVLKTDLERFGYLDERFFFLGNDDHDYHRRVYEAEGRRPVYAPMSLYAPLHMGAQRRKRTGMNEQVFRLLKREKRGSTPFLRFLSAQRLRRPEDIT
jgi:hypothetical protein